MTPYAISEREAFLARIAERATLYLLAYYPYAWNADAFERRHNIDEVLTTHVEAVSPSGDMFDIINARELRKLWDMVERLLLAGLDEEKEGRRKTNDRK